jgi:hypothetical protein
MTNNGATQCEESLMNISAPFVTNAQTPELMQPTERAFDHPAGFAQAAAMRPARARQSPGDAQGAQPTMMRTAAIRPIPLHDLGSLARTTGFAAQRRNRQHQGLQLAAVMHVGGGDLRAQWNALGIGAKMMFAARFAAVRRVWPRLKPPKTARTLLESTTARDQSIRSATCRRRNNSRWSFSHTPAFCQSRSRRQQVMPLPQPISSGRSRHAMPVLSTKRIPVSAARSEIGLRPGYFLRRARVGSKGWITDHNESSMSGFAIPSFLLNWSKKYNSFCYAVLMLKRSLVTCPNFCVNRIDQRSQRIGDAGNVVRICWANSAPQSPRRTLCLYGVHFTRSNSRYSLVDSQCSHRHSQDADQNFQVVFVGPIHGKHRERHGKKCAGTHGDKNLQVDVAALE